MNCYICGNEATKRLTPDMDIKGMPMCDNIDCKQLLQLVLFTYEDDENVAEKRLQKLRKKKHLENNNEWKP
jgi:hypothetical protein